MEQIAQYTGQIQATGQQCMRGPDCKWRWCFACGMRMRRNFAERYIQVIIVSFHVFITCSPINPYVFTTCSHPDDGMAHEQQHSFSTQGPMGDEGVRSESACMKSILQDQLKRLSQ